MPNWGGDPRVDPESTREIVYLIWTGNASGYPQSKWKMLLGRSMSGIPCLACCQSNPISAEMKKMDEWLLHLAC